LGAAKIDELVNGGTEKSQSHGGSEPPKTKGAKAGSESVQDIHGMRSKNCAKPNKQPRFHLGAQHTLKQVFAKEKKKPPKNP